MTRVRVVGEDDDIGWRRCQLQPAMRISMKRRQVDSLDWMFHVSAILFNASSECESSG